MKKGISFILALVMCLSLSACGVSSDSAYSFIARMDDEAFDPTSVSSKERERMFEADTFCDAVITTITGDISFLKACGYLAKLESMGYKNEDVKSAFDDLASNCLTELLSSNDNVDDIISFARAIALLPDDSYYYQDEYFVTTVCDLIANNKLTLIKGLSDDPTESEITKCLTLANGLEKFEYHDEEIRKELQAVIQRHITELSSDSIVRFVDDVQFDGEENYYFSIIDFFPYDVLVELSETEGKALSLTDGYYSENLGNYKNEHYWYDPLSYKKHSSGGVGLFEKTISYAPYGDFMYRDYKYIAFGSSGNGHADEKEQKLWLSWKYSNDDDKYHDITISKSKDTINTFLNIAKRGNIYGFGNSHKELLIAVIEKNMITFVIEDRGVMFSVSYS